jgi:hypothetical protein
MSKQVLRICRMNQRSLRKDVMETMCGVENEGTVMVGRISIESLL